MKLDELVAVLIELAVGVGVLTYLILVLLALLGRY